VKAGRIEVPDDCSRCGDATKPEAHHPNYARPLEVEWLCVPCHVVVHPHAPPKGINYPLCPMCSKPRNDYTKRPHYQCIVRQRQAERERFAQENSVPCSWCGAQLPLTPQRRANIRNGHAPCCNNVCAGKYIRSQDKKRSRDKKAA
jgi:hypothetical protein